MFRRPGSFLPPKSINDDGSVVYHAPYCFILDWYKVNPSSRSKDHSDAYKWIEANGQWLYDKFDHCEVETSDDDYDARSLWSSDDDEHFDPKILLLHGERPRAPLRESVECDSELVLHLLGSSPLIYRPLDERESLQGRFMILFFEEAGIFSGGIFLARLLIAFTASVFLDVHCGGFFFNMGNNQIRSDFDGDLKVMVALVGWSSKAEGRGREEKKMEVGVTTIQFIGMEIYDGKYQLQPPVAQELL
nr:hypothetical protein [Tanacetum cinerariifolium]